MNIAFNTAVSGMLTAHSQVASASENLVTSAAKGEGVIQAVVAVKQAESAHGASAVMARVASEMDKTLIDILA
jgi:hypothetical protein